MRQLTTGLCMLVAVCGCVHRRSPPIDPPSPPVPRTILVGQPWAEARAAATRAGYPAHDAAGLEYAPPLDGFYLNLPGDCGLVVQRSPADVVRSLDWVEHWSVSKSACVDHDVPAFELRPAG